MHAAATPCPQSRESVGQSILSIQTGNRLAVSSITSSAAQFSFTQSETQQESHAAAAAAAYLFSLPVCYCNNDNNSTIDQLPPCYLKAIYQEHLIHSQCHDHHGSSEDESKAVARALLTNETDIFDIIPPSPLENVIEDILAGSDQLYPTLSPSQTSYFEDRMRMQYHTISDDSDSSADTPLPRRRDSIMATEQALNSKEVKEDSGDKEQTAAQRVFGTYELLENILLDLAAMTNIRSFRTDIEGWKTTLLAQRVNKTFSHVIKRSTKLQEKLFFKYKAGKSRSFDEIAWNPFLCHPACTTGRAFLQNLYHDGFIQIEPQGPDMGDYLSLPSSFDGAGSGNGQGSWRRMLVCQGEPLDMQLNVNPHAPDRAAWWCPQLVVGTKATMGLVWDKVLLEREWKWQ